MLPSNRCCCKCIVPSPLFAYYPEEHGWPYKSPHSPSWCFPKGVMLPLPTHVTGLSAAKPESYCTLKRGKKTPQKQLSVYGFWLDFSIHNHCYIL
ncbi:hypothetical protein GDO78_019314 [Eleutherodactylus coqui]|uniref:Uncharacterized protein n=1 Tax=Eleutherodactylus coqui TaxID=57060 RepID=A0A8J6E7M2_ELECQ|nr:hypothetical protein GDO78_019314 [Eleutherodactylus coqui]